MGSIKYHMNYRKAIEVIVWLGNKKPGIDIYHIAKVLFYADKLHVNKYARPIIGDTYKNMDYGPVPSGVRDLITGDEWLNPNDLELIQESIIIDKSRYPSIISLRAPNLNYFSGTDIECLEESLKKYGDMTFDELKNLTHDERCYLATEERGTIDYSLMVDEENPNRDEILKNMAETSAYLQV